MSPVYLIAFSGHRTQDSPGRSAAELEQSRNLIERTLLDLQKQADRVDGEIHLAVSAAEGADLIACKVAIANHIPLHLILPLNIEDFKADFADPTRMHQWADVEEIIAHTQSGENNSTFRIAQSSHSRPDCYHETNLQLLDSADLLIALWDGVESSSPGGTHSIWLAAEVAQLPRIQINPIDQSTPTQNLENFAPPNDPGLKIIRELLPEKTHTPCELIQTLASDLDASANQHSKNTRDQTRRVIALHGTASFLAAIGISYALAGGPAPLKVLPIVALIELILIGVAEWIHFRLHHHGESWIKARFAAELLRPLHLTLPHLDPLRPLVRDHQPAWHRFLLSIGLAQPCPKQPSFQETKNAYLHGRIVDQLKHFTKKFNKAAPTATRLYQIMRWSAKGAFILILLAVIIKFTHFNDTPHGFTPPFKSLDFLLYLLPVALPLLAGILLSYRLSFDLGRRKLRYPEMIANLERAKIDLQNAHTPQALQQVITRTEEILLDELNEFHTAQRIGLEH